MYLFFQESFRNNLSSFHHKYHWSYNWSLTELYSNFWRAIIFIIFSYMNVVCFSFYSGLHFCVSFLLNSLQYSFPSFWKKQGDVLELRFLVYGAHQLPNVDSLFQLLGAGAASDTLENSVRDPERLLISCTISFQMHASKKLNLPAAAGNARTLDMKSNPFQGEIRSWGVSEFLLWCNGTCGISGALGLRFDPLPSTVG